MFDKLLALTPYNPGLVHQLAFYGQRMHEEATIRKIGLVFIILTFFIQFFAVLNPPQPSLAQSGNDLIQGGFSTAQQAHDYCQADTNGFQRVMHYYGISCAELKPQNTAWVTLNPSARNYLSAGYHPTGFDQARDPISGAGTVHWRSLAKMWQGRSNPETLRVTNNQGKTFYVMKDCANLVSVGVPSRSQLQETIAVGPGFGNVPEQPAPAPATPAPAPAPAPAAAPTPAAPAPAPTPTPTPPVEPCPWNPAIPKGSELCYEPCPYNNAIPITNNVQCKPCDKSSNQNDSGACVEVRKTATNVTAGIADANNTTANPGDTITYTLYAKNTGKATIKNYVFQENMSDVLDYADITDAFGGTLAVNNTIAWAPRELKAGETITQQITVKVKNPIPNTPVSSSDPAHFDLIMTNVYGNSINIKVPPQALKQAEMVATKLPNTGPGTTLAIAGAVVVFAGYFYTRARLLSKESKIAVKETTL